jgi:hypothetical protein
MVRGYVKKRKATNSALLFFSMIVAIALHIHVTNKTLTSLEVAINLLVGIIIIFIANIIGE